MRIVSNWIKLALPAFLAFGVHPAGAAQSTSAPANALIMFGANWCAPCLEELRQLPALARAAAPSHLLIAWRDGRPRALWSSWPDNAQFIQTSLAEQAMASAGGAPAGLPFAAMLDEHGQPCATLAGKLTVERIARMKAQCAKS